MNNEIQNVSRGSTALPAHLAVFAEADVGEVIDVEVSTPRIYMMQGQSPEVADGTARVGDIVLRSGGTSSVMGEWMHIVVVGVIHEFIWWDEESDRPLARCRYDQRGQLTPERRAETEWDGDNKPVASETITFIAMQYSPAGDALDPSGYGPFAVGFSSTSLKSGKKLAQSLKAEQAARRPYYLRAIGLKTVSETNDKGTFRVWAAAITDQWLGGATGSTASAEQAKGVFEEWQGHYKAYPQPSFSTGAGSAPTQQTSRPSAAEVKAEILQQEQRKQQAAAPAVAGSPEQAATPAAVYYSEEPPF